jgi:hypothetical protein
MRGQNHGMLTNLVRSEIDWQRGRRKKISRRLQRASSKNVLLQPAPPMKKKSTSRSPLYKVHTLICLALLCATPICAHASPITVTTTLKKSDAVIRIVDQNGRPVPNGVSAPAGQIFDVTVGPGFAFNPDELNISIGDTVRWTWASGGHSVTSGAS